MMDVEGWQTAALAFAAVGQVLFTTFYATFPWWKSTLGRTLFLKAQAFSLLLVAEVVRRFFDWTSHSLTFLVLYALLAVGIWAQLSAFIRVKVEAHRAHREPFEGDGL